MIGDTGQDVGEPGLGIDVVERQVVIIVSMTAARSAPRPLPAKVQFRFPKRCL
jgi:hypothetical protein